MAEVCPTSLISLPVEILYEILNYLNCEEIFLSFGRVCRRFRFITQTYHRYDLNFSSISKKNVDLICRLIQPKNVISLTLSNDTELSDQFSSYFSSLKIQKFVRLRHLTLVEVPFQYHSKLRRCLESCPLVSLTIQSRSNAVKSAGKLLNSLIEKPQLSRLTLRTKQVLINRIDWSNNGSLRYFRIERCTMKDYSFILRQLPLLETFVIDEIGREGEENLISTTHRSLKSLTINFGNSTMNKIKTVLSMTPSLRHLKVFGSTYGENFSVFDGNEWELLIQTTLVDLQILKLSLINNSHRCGSFDIDETIESFQSPFWLEDKRWFVCCEQSKSSNYRYHLYTIPFCDDQFHYHKIKEKLFSNPLLSEKNIMDQVKTLHINSKDLKMENQQKKIKMKTYNRFPQVTKLNLTLNPLQSVEYLSELIELTRIEDISLYLKNSFGCNTSLIDNFRPLLEQASNVHTLEIRDNRWRMLSNRITKDFYQMLPKNIRHIQIRVMSLEEMKEIFQANPHLSRLTFHYCSWNKSTAYTNFQDWLKKRGFTFTCQMNDRQLVFWIEGKVNESEDLFYSNKRMKTIDFEKKALDDLLDSSNFWNDLDSYFDDNPLI